MKIYLDKAIDKSYINKNLKLKGSQLYNDNDSCIGVVTLPEKWELEHRQESYPVRVLSENEINVVTYVELRGKSDYSIQRAIASPNKIIQKSDVGAGLTDLGTGFGLYTFNQAAIANNKKSILGCEFYVIPEGVSRRAYEYDNLVILAKNKTGYHDLAKLITLAASRVKASDTKQVRPAIYLTDLEIVDTSNFVVLSAYDEGAINKFLWQRSESGDTSARKHLTSLLHLIKPEDVYLEIQYQKDTDGWLEDDFSITEKITELANEMNVGLVLTNNYQMLEADDKEALHIMQAIGEKETVDKAKTLSVGRELYVHTTEEMERRNFPTHLLDATIEIWNKCDDYNLYSKKNFMPKFVVPDNFDTDVEYFEYIAKKGLTARMGVSTYAEINEEYRNRLEEEMDLIKSMGFVGYFLITADFISYAKRNFDAYDDETVARWTAFIKENGYNPAPIAIGPSRGSAGGSLVSYAMSITDIDPLKFGLLFERFLNPERVSMPDIDTDIPDTKRAEIIHYVKDYYNVSDNLVESRVSGIGVFGTYKLKALLKAVVRALYKNPTYGDKLASLVDDPEMSFDDYLELPEVQRMLVDDGRLKRIASVAPKLIGLVSNLSQHAAGYVIAPSQVTNYLPTTFVKNSDTGEMEQITAFTYVEAIGLLKMDFLGLRSMSIIQDAIDDINKDTNQELTITSIIQKAIPDLDTYKSLQKGYTKDIFQLGSDGMSDLVKRTLADVDSPSASLNAEQGDYFSRMIAVISIYRPGPLAYADQMVQNALHPEQMKIAVPEIADLLKTSYGLLIYQESIMALFRTIAGTSLGRADILRRAISKKKPEVLAEQKKVFIYGDESEGIPGGLKNTGRSVQELEELWKDIEAFAGYGFNKSHAAGYAHVMIIMAWLSHHYPTYFAASNLNHTDKDGLKMLMAYYKSRGIKTVPADINLSENRFTSKNDSVMFGLDGIKYLASNAPHIYQERIEHGDYQSLFDFVQRMAKNDIKVTKQTIEALIYSGALDSLPIKREDKISGIGRIADTMSLLKKAEGKTVFDAVPGYFEKFVLGAKPKNLSEKSLLQKEFEYTGFYISGHPTTSFKELTDSYKNYLPIEHLTPGQRDITILGIVKSTHRIMTKSGRPMAFITVEDSSGSIEVTVFPNTFTDFGRLLTKNRILLINGTTQDSGKFIVNSVKDAEEVRVATEIDHIQITLSQDKKRAGRDIYSVVSRVMSGGEPYSILIPLTYVFDGRELDSTKEVKHITMPYDNETVAFVKSVVGIDNFHIIWRSKLV